MSDQGASGNAQNVANQVLDGAQQLANQAVDVAEDAAEAVLSAVIGAIDSLGTVAKTIRDKTTG
jgi:hypothetical protein